MLYATPPKRRQEFQEKERLCVGSDRAANADHGDCSPEMAQTYAVILGFFSAQPTSSSNSHIRTLNVRYNSRNEKPKV